jgi:hypothetical protein
VGRADLLTPALRPMLTPTVRVARLVDIDAAGGVDPHRLLRALDLIAQPTSRGRYVVRGGQETHYVDLIDRQVERCDCGDFLLRNIVCKHLLACLLIEGDSRVLAALGGMVRLLVADNRRLRTLLRGRVIVLTRALQRRAAAAAGFATPDDLEFRRDRDGESSDVAIHRRDTGALIGRLTRVAEKPRFVSAAAATRVAA